MQYAGYLRWFRFDAFRRPPLPLPVGVRVTPESGGAWRSLVAHLLWEQRVGGSNPSAPTNSGSQSAVLRRDDP